MSVTDDQVVVVVGSYTDGETIFTSGFTTSRYTDPAKAAQLNEGLFLPYISPGSDFFWNEQIEFQPEGGGTTVAVSDIVLINTSKFFDEWIRYSVSGLLWEVREGSRNDAWEDMETTFKGVGVGLEFEGRDRVIVQLEDLFTAMRQPVSQVVFDESVANPRFINQRAPAVYGDVLQVEGDLIDPRFFRVYLASNLAVISQGQSGGKVFDNYTEVEGGAQVTQGVPDESLPITFNIGGPLLPQAELVDVLEDVGRFTSWDSSGHPFGIIVYDDPTDSQILEDVSNGGAEIDTTLVAGGTTETEAPGVTVNEFPGGNINIDLEGYDTGGTEVPSDADWPALIAADDAANIRWIFNGAFDRGVFLTIKDFGFAVPDDKTITGIELKLRSQRTTGSATVYWSFVQVSLPNGSLGPNQANDEIIDGTKSVETYGDDEDLWGLGRITPAVLNDPNFGFRLRVRLPGVSDEPTEVSLFQVEAVVHYNDGSKTVRLYIEDAFTAGARYRVRITYDDLGGSPEGDLLVRYAGVDAEGDPVPFYSKASGSLTAAGELSASENYGDTAIKADHRMKGAGFVEGEVVADGPVAAFEFYPQAGVSNSQRITVIEAIEISVSSNTFRNLSRRVLEDADLDPEEFADDESLQYVEDSTGNAKLGWYVRSQTTRTQLLTTKSHSLSAASWGSVDGLWSAALMELPAEPSGEFLTLEPHQAVGPGRSTKDKGPDLRDRVNAQQNIDPIRFNETAGVGDDFTEEQRQLAIAPWRITERADFDEIAGGTDWPIPPPPPSIVSITPNTGTEAGGDTVTIVVANYTTLVGGSVTFDAVAGTNYTVVNSTTIEVDTPAGTAGDVDVVVTVGAESATETDGFEFTGSPVTDTQVEFTSVGAGTWNVPAGVTSVDIYLVGGGGAGGANRGGGGGAGGCRKVTGHAVTPGATLNYTVGGGGSGNSSNASSGGDGQDTVFDGESVTGGGGGAAAITPANDGGSGGGAAHAASDKTGGAGTVGQGNDGGDCGGSATSGAGGGGAGAVGQDDQGNDGGDGGSGVDWSSDVGALVGDSGVFGGGGGGGGWNNVGGIGGSGGGGDGASESGAIAAQDGAANTGGGGGGGTDSERTGGDGGSGIIIIRYQA